ncbi:MAG: hypothetical protein L3J43_05150 [Sulfurovum sp.]|nr:hypothetical protein [Sulfurovum sp.]
MKILSIVFGVIFISALFIYYISTKTIEISNTEFEIEFENSKIQHSIYTYKLLGLRDNSIFMSKKEMIPFLNKWKETIIYTNFYNLSKKTQKNINQVIDSSSNDGKIK